MSTKQSSTLLRFAALSALVWLGSSSAQAEDTTTNANRTAYDAAIKCFIANSVAKGNSSDAGYAAQAATYETKARESFDIAVTLGKTLGYSGGRINQDMGMAQGVELPKLVQDEAYFRQAVTTCQALGLM